MHYKQNNKESKTYVQGLRPFGNTLPRGVKGILKKNGYNYSEIISKWKMLVGKNIANCSYPKSIKMSKGNSNGTLVIAVKRGNEIDIEYSKKDIMDKIHTTCVKYGTQKKGFVNYVDGANIGGFVRVADSMVDQGVI